MILKVNNILKLIVDDLKNQIWSCCRKSRQQTRLVSKTVILPSICGMGGSTLNQSKEKDKEMKTKKQIQPDRWIGYTDALINDNRGRIANIEVYNENIGREVIVHQLPLQDTVYDPVGKGDALTFAFGQQKVEVSHIVESPVEIWELHNDNGQVISIEINDHNDVLTIVKFSD